MLNRIMLGVLPLCVGLAGYGAWWILDVPIEKFVVRGDLSAMEQAKVNETLAQQQFGGILSTDLDEVSAVLQQLPWARGITVRRQWPDAVVITLQRANPIARWGSDRYLSASGELISLPDKYLGLPHFDVAVASPAQTMGVYRLLDQVLLRAGLHIAGLAQNQQGEWSVEMRAQGAQSTLTLLLGAEQLNERAHRFLLLQRQVLADAQRSAAYVDARYASGLAVRYEAENFDPLQMPDKTHPERLAALSALRNTNLPGGSN